MDLSAALLDVADESAWLPYREQWALEPGTVYLNHGSWGPSPRAVLAARQRWLLELEANPVKFYYRRLRDEIAAVRERLAGLLGTSADRLVLVENATYGMNAVADSFPLAAGDEVLLNDHEYGAVLRIWQRACRRAGAAEPVVAEFPRPLEDPADLVESLMAAATERTRLIVVSHVTSVTGLILPVAEICAAARQRGIAVCIDGPHALAQTTVALDALDCDYYTASCHKWLCAPFGTGLLYVHPRRQRQIEPATLSWGRWDPAREESDWRDEFLWQGTHDPSGYLSISAAIDFIDQIGMEAFRRRAHYLTSYARQRIAAVTGQPPLARGDHWYCAMAQMPLPAGDRTGLQAALSEQHGIEVPINVWHDRRSIRVSAHVYTQRHEIDQLADALQALLQAEGTL